MRHPARPTLVSVLLIVLALVLFMILPARAYGACYAVMLSAVALEAAESSKKAGLVVAAITAVVAYAGAMGHSGGSGWILLGSLLYLCVAVCMTLYLARRVQQRRAPAPWNELLKDLLDAVPMGFALHRLDGSFIDVNPALAALNGISREQHRGRAVQDVMPHLAPQILAHVQEVIATAAPMTRDLEGGTHDDSPPRLWKVTYFPLRDAAGKVEAVGAAVQDTTDEQLAQDEVAVSEARYRFLAESMPQYVWTSDSAGKVDYCNRHFLEFAGLTLEQVRAGGIPSLIHPDDRDEMIRRASEAHKLGLPFDLEYRVRRASDGEYRWHMAHSEVVLDEHGNRRRVGVGVDVTERRKAEEQLRHAHEQIQAIVNSISDSFIALDREWRVQFANPRVLQKMNVPLEQVQGRSLWELSPKAVEAFLPGYKRVMEEGTAQAFETNWRGLDGVERHYAVNAFPTPDGIAALVSDITDQKAALQQLEESRRQLRLVLDAAGIASWIVDVPTGRIMDLGNTSVLFGLSDLGSMEEFYRHVHPEDQTMVRQAVTSALATGSYRCEYRVPGQGRGVRWLRSLGTVYFDDEHRPMRMAGVVFDITERRENEEVMRRTEKLAAAGRLAATIAHEINNPLEAVTNLLYLLHHSEDPEERRRYLDSAQQELARVSHITRQSLGFYRDSASAVEFRVAETVESLAELYGSRMAAKQIRLEVIGASDLVLVARRGEFTQVLSNLLSNAIDALEPGGRIRIRWKVIGNVLSMSVADTGPGIAADVLGKLFAPFFTTQAETGTGLGLFVSRDLLEKQGGSLRVRSRTAPPSGTVFTIRMPLGARATNS